MEYHDGGGHGDYQDGNEQEEEVEMSFLDRTDAFMRNRDSKKESLRKKLDDEKTKEATFKPAIKHAKLPDALVKDGKSTGILGQ